MRLLTLADVAREVVQPYGVEIVEVGGWQGNGNELIAPDVALRHWTAGSPYGVFPSYRVLLEGRSGLPGPLCNLGQSREDPNTLDKIYVMAGGKANHAGEGGWNGVTGNYYSLGLEIEWSGPNESFSDKRVLVSELAMIILMRFCGNNPDDACEHREWTPRKIDTNLDGNVLRQVIRQGYPSVIPAPPPTPNPPPLEDEMPAPSVVIDSTGKSWYFARGIDGALWYRTTDVGWKSLGGRLTSGPVATLGPDNTIEVVARGADPNGSVFSIRWNGTQWGGWVKIGGQT